MPNTYIITSMLIVPIVYIAYLSPNAGKAYIFVVRIEEIHRISYVRAKRGAPFGAN